CARPLRNQTARENPDAIWRSGARCPLTFSAPPPGLESHSPLRARDTRSRAAGSRLFSPALLFSPAAHVFLQTPAAYALGSAHLLYCAAANARLQPRAIRHEGGPEIGRHRVPAFPAASGRIE